MKEGKEISLRDRKRGKRWGLHSCFNTLSGNFLERSIGILDTKFGKGLRTSSDNWSPDSAFNTRKETDCYQAP